MQELLVPIFEYLRGIWRHRWVALAVAWVVCLGGWAWVAQVPEKYVATARVNIDTNTVLRPLLKGIAIQPNVNQRVALLSKTLLSRPNLEKIMRMTDLDLQAQDDRDKEKILLMLGKNIRLIGDRRNASLYTVSFTHDDREMAKRVVQSVLTIFVESMLGEKRVESEGAQEFLDQQIAEYEKRLEMAEKRLAEFKRRNVGNMPNDAGGYYRKLEQLKGQLSATELKLRELQNRRAKIRQQLEEQVPMMGDPFAGADQTPLDARIRSLHAQMDNLLIKYTAKHPEVRQIKSLLQQLEKEREQQVEESLASGVPTPAMQANPIFQQLQNMASNADAEIASLTVRVAEYRQRVKALAQKIDSIPKIEAQLKQLNRDYEVIAQQHNALLKRRESARLGEKAGARADDVKFKVIDPPFVPSRPTEPDKLLLNSIVLLLGLVAGAGVALLMSLLRPVFSDRRRLELVTGLPILGSVSRVPRPGEAHKRWMMNVIFLLLLSLLILAFGVVSMDYLDPSFMGQLKDLRTRWL